MDSIKIVCPAKINLDLRVFPKNNSTGYHNIKSIMQTISLFDFLSVKISKGNTIELSGTSNEISYDEKNLCYKAARAFLDAVKKECKIEIFIEKNIPVAAGLAGGSTDAAGVIFGLNKIFDYPLSLKQMHELAFSLGSDLNFCLEGGTKLCTGRGEKMINMPFYDFKLALILPKDLKISAKEAYDAFDNLKQEKGLRQIYSSYDFRLEEKPMLESWEKILEFLLTDIFNTFGVKMSDLKKYLLIKNKIPVGLNNIIQQFRIEQKYITDADLKDINFYQINFPELYPKQTGYISSFFGGLKSIINFTGTKIGCNEDNDNNDPMKIRTDITEEEKNKIIPDSQIIFNYEKFKYNCNNILSILNDILIEEDIEVISTSNFIKLIKERYIDNKDGLNQYSLPYGIDYIDHILFYLSKIKKVILFNIEANNKNLEFIKLTKTVSDTVTNKDEAIAKTLSQMELLEKRNSEYEKKIEQITDKAKAQIKKGNKQAARTLMIKKKNYQKFLENSQNTHSILEKQIFDLKNAESNANFTEVLKQAVEVGKQYNANIDEFAEITDDIKERKDVMDEIQSGIKDLNLMNENDENINKELEELEQGINENKKEDEFPMANNEDIVEEKIVIEQVVNDAEKK